MNLLLYQLKQEFGDQKTDVLYLQFTDGWTMQEHLTHYSRYYLKICGSSLLKCPDTASLIHFHPTLLTIT